MDTVNQCPYTATTCPLLAPFSASNPHGQTTSPLTQPPTPSACASAHAVKPSSPRMGYDDPQSHRQQQQQQQEGQYDPYGQQQHGGSSNNNNNNDYPGQDNNSYDSRGEPSVPIHTLAQRGSSSSAPTPTGRGSPPDLGLCQPPSSSYNTNHPHQPPIYDCQDSYGSVPSSSSLGQTPSSRSPPDDIVTPSSFIHSPPINNQDHLRQPVFLHNQPSNGDAYSLQSPSSLFQSAPNGAPFVKQEDFLREDGGGAYGTLDAEDMEDIGFGRRLPPQPPRLVSDRSQQQRQKPVLAGAPTPAATRSIPDEPASSGAAGAACGEQTAFISKLWHLLTHPEYSRYLTWNRAGDAFLLSNQNEFAQKVLPRFFRHSNVASFIRQLNLYSFQRVSTIQLLDMADASTSTSIVGASSASHHHSHNNRKPHIPHLDASYSADSDSDSNGHHSSSPPPANTTSAPTQDASVAASGFTHPYFQRDRPDLLGLLKPRGSTRKQPQQSTTSRKAAAAAAGGGGHRVGEEQPSGAKRGSVVSVAAGLGGGTAGQRRR